MEEKAEVKKGGRNGGMKKGRNGKKGMIREGNTERNGEREGGNWTNQKVIVSSGRRRRCTWI